MTTPETTPEEKSGISRRGFGSMSAERKREIAILGGKAAHAMGVAHRFTPEEAKAAQKKRKPKNKAE